MFDTTLRDGEQSPGVSFSIQDKIDIARGLSLLGVDVCEIGFPANPSDFEGVKRIADEMGSVHDGNPMKLAVLARCVKKDIDKAFEAVRNAPLKRIHVFYGTSDLHLKYKLKKTPEEALKAIKENVEYAKSVFDDVEFSPEDAGRTSFEFLVKVCDTAIAAGASTINIADTVGYTLPHEYFDTMERLINETKRGREVVWSTHCHNDLGLGTANTLSGVRAGARQVEVTVNGIGERAGNTSLEEVVIAIQTHPLQFEGVEHSINTKMIVPISRLVERLSGMPVQRHKAIVGRNAFKHESGIHADGFLKNRETYEIIHPYDVGWTEEDIESGVSLGKTSGKAAYKAVMHQYGFAFESEDHFLKCFTEFKNLTKGSSTPTIDQIKGSFTPTSSLTVVDKSLGKTFQIVELIGDGVSQEITREAIKVIHTIGNVFGHKFNIEQRFIGGASIDDCGLPISDETIKICHNSDAVLLGAVGDPRFDDPSISVRPEQGLLRIRSEMGLYENLRPVAVPDWIEDASPLKNHLIHNTDFIIVRELTGGIYNSDHIYYEKEGKAIDMMVYTIEEIQRIARRAGELAIGRRKKVTSIHKANVLACSRLWKTVTTEIFKTEFPEVQLEHVLVDSAAIHLLKRPSEFDIILCPNLFGDILSDEAAALTCSLGMLPSACLGDPGKPGLFEPVHGSAPDIAGKNIVNPTGAILSAALMLRYGLGLEREAKEVEIAMDSALRYGNVTADIARDGQHSVSTDKVGDSVCDILKQKFMVV